MPCQSGPMYDERTDWRVYKKDLDELTAEADRLREIILSLAEGKDTPIPPEFLAEVAKRQVAHRKVDLKRLEAVFIKSKMPDKLAKVWKADPKKPLEPQLGFDPDAY